MYAVMKARGNDGMKVLAGAGLNWLIPGCVQEVVRSQPNSIHIPGCVQGWKTSIKVPVFVTAAAFAPFYSEGDICLSLDRITSKIKNNSFLLAVR